MVRPGQVKSFFQSFLPVKEMDAYRGGLGFSVRGGVKYVWFLGTT